jgi:hypothetical protein
MRMIDQATDLRRSAHRTRWILFAGFLMVMGAWACSDSSNQSPIEVRDPSEVEVIALDASAPPLTTDSVSFYAVQGQDRSVEMYFDSAGVQTDRLLRFEVDKDALRQLPNGQRIRGGDSVLITIRIKNPGTLQFDFSPSGLVFDDEDPAELTIGYNRALVAVTAASGLLSGSGSGSGRDGERSESDLSIWLQEDDSSPFFRVPTKVDLQGKELEAKIPGFSKYAVAY